MGMELRREAHHDHDHAHSGGDGSGPDSCLTDGPAAPALVGAAPLTVGAADDRAEHEADAVADRVLARLEPRPVTHQPAVVRREPGPAGGIGAAGGALDASTQDRLSATAGRGAPLGGEVGSRMEQAFGRSFTGVRIHTDGEASALAGSMSASAFTVGNDIYFGRGQFAPETPEGEHLLAHELAHVVQAGRGVHRFFGRKKDPAKEAQKEKEREDKKKAKEADKLERQKKKDEAKARKGAISDHKELEKTELKDLEAERVRGKAGRAAAKEKVYGKGGGGADHLKDIHARFAAALEREKALLAEAKQQGKSDTEAVDYAYKGAWLDTDDEEIRSHRPPRETQAERLLAEIRKMRQDDRLGTVDDDGKVAIQGERRLEMQQQRGLAVHKDVEKVYEQWAVLVRERTHGKDGKPIPGVDPAKVEAEVGLEVWAKAPEKTRLKRPTDERIEFMARRRAAERVIAQVEEKKEKDGLDSAQSLMKTVNGKVMPIVGGASKAAQKVTAQVGKSEDSAKDIVNPLGKTKDSTPVVGEFISSINTAKARKDKDLRGNDHEATMWEQKSSTTHAASAIGDMTSALTSLLGGVQNILKIVKSVSKASEAETHHERLEIAKDIAAGVQSLNKTGASIAKFAKDVDPGVAKEIMGKVIPGFNIATSAISLASNAMTLAQHGIRMKQTNDTLDEVRSGKPVGGEANVMVWPLWHVQQGYVKQVEHSLWDTSAEVVTLASNIANVAAAGGFGIPAAVNAGVSLLTALHEAGHFIADQVLVKLAKKAAAHRTGQLEGAAQESLRREPAMAVDAIVLKARKGDETAKGFLGNFGFDDDAIAKGQLSEFREKILGELGESADPAYFYKQYQDKLTGSSGFVTKWKKTSHLAKARNEDEKKSGAKEDKRGFGWKLKMFIKSVVREGEWDKSVAKTEGMEQGDRYVLLRFGKAILMQGATDADIEKFEKSIEAVPDGDLTFALADANTPEAGKLILQEILVRRLQAKPLVMKAGA